MSGLVEQAVLIGAAAWRLTALVSYERGPFDIFLKLRGLLGFQHGDNGVPTAWPSGVIQEMISCPWCLGLWMAGAMYGLWQLEPQAVMVLAAASVVVVVERWARP